MKKKKILFTIPNFDTAGSGKALLKIARGLNAEEFEPHIACFHTRGAFFGQVEKSGIPVHVVPFAAPMRPLSKGLMQCFKTAWFFRKNGFDLIHSYHYSADYSEPLAARLAGIKWVYTKKNMNWGGKSANGWRLRSRLANRIAVQNHDMEREFFPKSKKTFYLTRGVDTSEFYPRAYDSKLPVEIGIYDPQVKIIINVANMVPVKGLDVLIRAFSQLKNEHLRLVLVGDNKNEYGHQLQELVKELKLDEKVLFTGKRSDVNRFLSVASVFVLPTLNEGRKEGSPVALLEAMACGVPVIGSDIPGIRDQLEGYPQLLTEPKNVDMLAQKLEHLLKLDDGERNQLKESLVNRIRNHFTIEREIADHERLYRECLSKHK